MTTRLHQELAPLLQGYMLLCCVVVPGYQMCIDTFLGEGEELIRIW